jgi:hypothetical protein
MVFFSITLVSRTDLFKCSKLKSDRGIYIYNKDYRNWGLLIGERRQSENKDYGN